MILMGDLVSKIILGGFLYIACVGIVYCGCMLVEVRDKDMVAALSLFWPITVVIVIILKLPGYVTSIFRGCVKIFKEAINVLQEK